MNDFDWEKEGFVSVWVGDFASQEEFDDFFEERIADDSDGSEAINKFADSVGFGFYDHDFQEAEYFGETKLPVEELLSPFSHSSSFIEQASASAENRDINEANSAVLLFRSRFEGVTKQDSPLKFIGSFAYDENSSPASEIQ